MAMATKQVTTIGIGEAAHLLAVTPNAVRAMAIAGKLRFTFRHGTRERRFRLSDVLELREQRKRNPERRGRKMPLIDLLKNIEQASSAPMTGNLQNLVGDHAMPRNSSDRDAAGGRVSSWTSSSANPRWSSTTSTPTRTASRRVRL